MFSDLSTPVLFGVFAAAALVIVAGGVRMTGEADRIADRTGFGEAMVGGVLLGAATSLSGIIVSVTSAYDGRASLAFSNAVGGIAAQTAFLAVADILHRRANLEHAAADAANVFQGALLMLLLALPLAAWLGPEVAILGVHPASVLLLVIYVGGVVASERVRKNPMWEAVETSETFPDEPDDQSEDTRSDRAVGLSFGLLMLAMGTAGYAIAQVAAELTDRFELRASLIGALMTAVVTSLPELITTLAAVRRGALQLAVGGIIGGNTFDTLFLVFSDAAYRDGSLYHAAGREDFFWLTTGLVMTAILTLGQLYRQREGPGKIGLESLGILLVYAAAVAIQSFSGGG